MTTSNTRSHRFGMPFVLSPALAIVLLAATTPAVAQEEEIRLRPADPIQSDIFGYDVAFDGTTILGGAPFGTYLGIPLAGRAYVFSHDGSKWIQQQRLLPSTRQPSAFFGVNLTLDGDALAIAASGEDTHTSNAGAVYIFEQENGVWREVIRLAPSALSFEAGFGSSLDMQGNTLMVGAWGDEHAGHAAAGSVFVYERAGGLWSHTDTLHTDDPAFDDNFGASISIDGDTAIIGAIDSDHSGTMDAGAVYVFQKIAGVWEQTGKLIASDPAQESFFGGSVALQGDTLIIGAENVDAAYLFERTNGSWSEVQRWNDGAGFGVDVDIDGRTIIIGAYLQPSGSRTGVTHVIRKVGTQWRRQGQPLVASDPSNTLYGWRLALKGDRAAIAGPFFNTNQGAIYVMNGMSICYADCDPSTGMGVLDIFDFLCFQNSFVNGESYACDCDITTGTNPPVCDIFDFLCFQNAFVGGCQ